MNIITSQGQFWSASLAAMEGFSGTGIGPKVLGLRRQRGWSAEKLAAEADVSLPTIRRVERGHYPRVEHLIALADCLGVTTDYLVGRGPDHAESP